jgi:hypothetical protein
VYRCWTPTTPSTPCARRCCIRCAGRSTSPPTASSRFRARCAPRRPALPIASPLWGPLVGTARRAVGQAPLPDEIGRYLRFGRGVDTARMRSERFRPRYSTLDALARACLERPEADRRHRKRGPDARGGDPHERRRLGLRIRFARTMAPLDALYTRWWRIRADGAEHVGRGPALIVANQAGGQPWTRRCSPPPCAAATCAATIRRASCA